MNEQELQELLGLILRMSEDLERRSLAHLFFMCVGFGVIAALLING